MNPVSPGPSGENYKKQESTYLRWGVESCSLFFIHDKVVITRVYW